jgi:hypothetical protein
MKKTLALILALLTAITTLVSCANSSETTVEESDTAATTEAETKEYYYGDLPQDKDYEGYTFTIMAPWPTEWGVDSYDRAETTGDTINDAIYYRNAEVEEMYNVKIATVEAGDTGTQAQKLQPIVMAGDNSIDMVAVGYYQSAVPLITNNLLTTWNDVPYINYEKDWWNHNITDTLTLNGRIYLLVGDINWFTMPETMVCYFNKQVATDNKVGDMYQIVNDGDWTFDKLYTTASAISNDVNGDGKWTDADQYGCIQNTICGITGFMYAADQYTVVKGDTAAEMHFTDEKTVAICEYVYKLCCENNISYVEAFDFSTNSKGIKIFFDNRALYYFDVLMFAQDFRAEDSDFGIIPYPKYDEAQKNYTTYCNQWGLSCALPITTPDKERSGIIIEALSAASRKYIVPAYYDKVLTGKLIRDNESEKMLDIIFGSQIFDFGLSYCTNLDFIPLKSLIESKKSDIVTWYAKREKKITKNFTDLYDYILGKGAADTAAQ